MRGTFHITLIIGVIGGALVALAIRHDVASQHSAASIRITNGMKFVAVPSGNTSKLASAEELQSRADSFNRSNPFLNIIPRWEDEARTEFLGFELVSPSGGEWEGVVGGLEQLMYRYDPPAEKQ